MLLPRARENREAPHHAPPPRAAGTAQPQAPDGERAYDELQATTRAGKDKEMVRHALETMRKCEPKEHAALMAYHQQRKAERAQLPMS